MSNKPKIQTYKTLRGLVTRLRDDLNSQDFVLLYAYNGTGKTRLSMAFKDAGKRRPDIDRDTLYFNAYTEDLFYWDNDLINDSERHLSDTKDLFRRILNAFLDRYRFELPELAAQTTPQQTTP